MDYNLNVGNAQIQTADIVLKSDHPVLRVVLDYILEQGDNAAFNGLVTKYAQPIANGDDGPSFVRSPLHAGNTFAVYVVDPRHFDKPTAMFMRIIDKFNFIAKFAIETSKDGALSVTPQRYNQDRGSTLSIDKLTLPVPTPYAAVLLVTEGHEFSHTLVGINKTNGNVFRIPTPNMHWENASLCVGAGVSDNIANALVTGDILRVSEAFDSWEASEWNADLTQSLPADTASAFLSWDVLGRYRGASMWATCEKRFPLNTDNRNVPSTLVYAAKFARSLVAC